MYMTRLTQYQNKYRTLYAMVYLKSTANNMSYQQVTYGLKTEAGKSKFL